jgi:hypothetical protein
MHVLYATTPTLTLPHHHQHKTTQNNKNENRLTTLMPGELEDNVFHSEYTCPQCGSGRDMVIRKS